jgi:predicted MFS family arabinose efflux permease
MQVLKLPSVKLYEMSSTKPLSDTASDRSLALRIIPVVSFTVITYFCVGVCLAVLPTFVHQRLGLNAAIAGVFVSLQYIATFASRGYAGRTVDTLGPREAVRRGIVFSGVSGLLLIATGFLQHLLWPALVTLALSRFALGVGESLGGVGAIMWGIGRVGNDNTARVIAWNGVATYTPIALGAPIGILIADRFGIATLGAVLIVVCAAGFLFATRMEPTTVHDGERMPMRQILPRVTPYGLGLALGGFGFGVIAAFVTLYFDHQHWQGAAFSLTLYGCAFIFARIVFAGAIDRFGGFLVAAVSFGTEALGLVVLALGHTRELAYVGCTLTGLGFSLIFPALGVEAANIFPPQSRGSVLAVYSAFVDLALFLTGPIAGILISSLGYSAVFIGVAGAVMAALGLTIWLASAAHSRPESNV